LTTRLGDLEIEVMEEGTEHMKGKKASKARAKE
jgi:hypothetical protein